jgi:hypothetical protein
VHLAALVEGETIFRHRRAAHVAAQPLELAALLRFDPDSRVRVAPGESIRVKAELQTREKPTTVGAGFQGAAPVAGGSVTPSQGRSEAGAAITFTYTAPKEKAGNKGFGVAAVSRAGVAEAKWAPLASQALKFEGLSFVCVIPVPGKEPMHMEQRITGESCGDPGSWTIRPTNIVRGPGVNKVDPDPPFQTSCVPAGSPEAESQLRARRARLAPAAGCAPTRPKPMAR